MAMQHYCPVLSTACRMDRTSDVMLFRILQWKLYIYPYIPAVKMPFISLWLTGILIKFGARAKSLRVHVCFFMHVNKDKR